MVTGHPSPAATNTAVDHDLTALRSFTVGLHRDIEVVTAGLTSEYNYIAVEGTLHKIKARKMQLFGRANYRHYRHHQPSPEHGRPSSLGATRGDRKL